MNPPKKKEPIQSVHASSAGGKKLVQASATGNKLIVAQKTNNQTIKNSNPNKKGD